jgi:tubulin beta
LVDSLLDVIRAEVERSDCLHGFQILHSISGGTGAGMGTLVISKLREEFPDRMLWTYSTTGSTRGGESIAISYNNILSMHQLIENSDTVVFMEDDAANSLVWKHKIQPTTRHLNTLWSAVMSDITSGMRFPTQARSDLRKMSLNLVPFPRVHFMSVATSPLSANRLANMKDTTTFKDITSQLFDKENLLLDSPQQNGGAKHMAASCFFRGDIPTSEIDDRMAEMQNKYSQSFSEWIPDNIKTTLCSVPPIHLNMSGTALLYTTAIIDSFKVSADRFNAMFRRKAFLHWFIGEGMDEMEFTEAISNVEDLMCEYQQYQEAKPYDPISYNSDDEVE